MIGGCWFCGRRGEEVYFSMEFDSFLHIECLLKTKREDLDGRETDIIFREFFGSDLDSLYKRSIADAK